MSNYDKCPKCGMLKISPTDYHPDAACVMFRQLKQSDKVEMYLRAVVTYGMVAARAGISLRTALHEAPKVKLAAPRVSPLDDAMAELCARLREHYEAAGHPCCPDPECGELFDEHTSDCAYAKYVKAQDAAIANAAA